MWGGGDEDNEERKQTYTIGIGSDVQFPVFSSVPHCEFLGYVMKNGFFLLQMVTYGCGGMISNTDGATSRKTGVYLHHRTL